VRSISATSLTVSRGSDISPSALVMQCTQGAGGRTQRNAAGARQAARPGDLADAGRDHGGVGGRSAGQECGCRAGDFPPKAPLPFSSREPCEVTLWRRQGLTNIMVIYHGEIFRNQSGMATARESLASAAGYAAWFTCLGAALDVASARTAATRALARSRPIRSRDRRLSREMGRPVSARCAASRTRALASSPAGRTGVAGAGASSGR
jgi:hypothetical protein